ncbi:kinase-like protein, partial [Thelephora ganbajun]
LSEVAEGLSYLHSRNVIHGDLKGPNILVDGSGRMRIADFGFTAVTKNQNSIVSALPHRGCTAGWAAPEVFNEEIYNKEADIFSFAMVMIEVFTGAAPFSGSQYRVMTVIAKGERPPRPEHPAVTDGLWGLIQRCWDQEPRLRPEAAEVLQVLPASAPPAWKRLVAYPLSAGDRISLITSLFSDRGEVEMAGCLSGGDAQAFIDAVDGVLDSLKPEIHRECLYHLANICGSQALLPKSLHIPLRCNLTTTPEYSGGFADVWKDRCNDQQVAVRTLRVNPTSDFEQIRREFCREVMTWRTLRHPNVLPLLGATMTENQFVTVSEWMDNGNINEFLRNSTSVNRLELLRDITKGLTYLHDRGVIHGNLKGANIMINKSGRACLSSFNLVVLISDRLTINSTSSTSTHRGYTVGWAAPEVMTEEVYSKKADIFSFAMVMTEVFTGAVPFSNVSQYRATSAIVEGERPPRPKHPAVTGGLWKLMQRCWDHNPHLRLEALEVLHTLLTLDLPAWERLINHTLSTDERISLITSLFSDRDEVEMVGYLSGDDAQAFIDVIDEALDSLPQQIHRRCLRSLYRICGSQALLPKSLQVPVHYDSMGVPHARGGFADVWKGQYDGLEVAAKALRLYSRDNLEKIRRRFCREVMIWRTLRHPNVLPLLGATMTKDQFVMVSPWMDNGSINEFLKRNGTSVNRLELLRETTRGLIYMHDQGVLHGDFKGANIMIDKDGHARLADFSLITLIPDQSTFMSSCMEGGALPWMSPELLDPESFGLKERHPTKESDCYALGMVIYEVLSGQAPFATYSSFAIVAKVLRDERPERPQGERGGLFTDGIWEVVVHCWRREPSDRASARDVLLHLGGTLPPLRPSSPNIYGDPETDSDDQSDFALSDF